MSWTKLSPILKSTGKPMASASIVVNKDGVPKVQLILAASLRDEFDEDKADVSAGSGDLLGSLLIEFKPDGAFEVRNFVSGGGRIFLPIPEGIAAQAEPNHPCTMGEKTKESVVIRLPLEAWAKASAPPAAPKLRDPLDPPPPPVAPGTSRVDLVEYLRNRGVKISRLAEGRFSVDGETVTVGAVLKLVNKKRAAADLDPLTHSQVV